MRRAAWTFTVVASLALVGVGAGAPAQADSYRVKKGDTLSAVAKRFGTTVGQLAAANGITNRHHVVVGRVLRIPAGPGPAGPSPASTGSSAAPQPPPGADGVPRGYDLSFPQCAGPLPTAVAFAIVGVNGGRPYTVNPCLRAQSAWAASAADQQRRFYVNTSNPGPLASGQWPSGHTSPRRCAAAYPANDSLSCAYDFGYESARFAAAQVPRALRARWWLDVETVNTWSANQAANLSAIQGTIDYFRERGAQVGVYSTNYQWGLITGGAAMPNVPVWVAGAGDFAAAVKACGPAFSFTGGRVAFTQYGAGAYDANHRC